MKNITLPSAAVVFNKEDVGRTVYAVFDKDGNIIGFDDQPQPDSPFPPRKFVIESVKGGCDCKVTQ